MPLKVKKWEDVPERERRNYYGKEEFEEFEKELAELAGRFKREMSPQDFSEWLSDKGREWAD